MDVPADQDLYQRLLESSFRFLSYRPRSEKEVRDFLLKKIAIRKISDQRIAERVLSRLRELGYVDDKKFTSWWLEARARRKPKGARLLTRELKAKGVTVTDVPIDERALARHALAKKLPLWQKLPKPEQKKKIYGFLGRRGFSTDVIYRLIDEVTRGRVE